MIVEFMIPNSHGYYFRNYQSFTRSYYSISHRMSFFSNDGYYFHYDKNQGKTGSRMDYSHFRIEIVNYAGRLNNVLHANYFATDYVPDLYDRNSNT